jgi:hypothetical protein
VNLLLENWDYNDTASQRFAFVGSEIPQVAAGGRRGTNCCQAVTEDGWGSYTVDGDGTSLYCGVAVQYPTVSGLGKILGVGDPTASGRENIYLYGFDDGSIAIYRSPSTLLARSAPAVLSLGGNYQYIECSVTLASGGAGAVEVRINGTPLMALTAVTTHETGSTTPSLVTIYPQGRRRYDDLYVNRPEGLYNNGFEGDVRIDTHYAASAGQFAMWNRSTGSVQNETIDEHPPDDDTTYNYATSAELYDSFFVDRLIPAFLGVRAVSVLHRARQVGAGAGAFHAVVVSAGDVYPQHATTSGYLYYETSLHTLAQTLLVDAGFNAAEIGYRTP